MLAAIIYHKVLDNRTDRIDPFNISVSKETFQSHVRVLAEHLPIIDGRALLDGIGNLISSKQVYVLFTFDDGYRSGVTAGAEILAEYGLRGVAFVSPWHIDRNEDYWWDTLAAKGSVESDEFMSRQVHLMSLPYENASRDVGPALGSEPGGIGSLAGWDTLRVTSPVLDVAFHGYRHDPPSAVPVRQWQRDIRKAGRRFAEEQLTPLPIIAYPYGSPGAITEDHVSIAASEFELGFVATHRIAKPSDEVLWRWKLPRIFASDRPGGALYSEIMARIERTEKKE
ncbi:MAG: polysaccharide deacetylase family protein [Chloroflexi bacterium]|nr:polysaccharide deacetylase family protein [Chloroflexota bacterium]